MHLLTSCLLSLAVCALPASEVDQIVAERDSEVQAAEAVYADAVAKALGVLDSASAKADAEAVEALVRVAKRAARGGDMTTGAQAWKAILRYDREHTEARGFFHAIGQLDAVLAELEQAEVAADLLGTPKAAPAEADAALGPGQLASLAAFGTSQVRSLSLGTDAIGGLSSPLSRIPDELAGASFIQPPLIATESIRIRCFAGGTVALVAGPGYSGLDQMKAAGFAKSESSLGVANHDQVLYLKRMSRGEDLELPAGPLMVIAGTIRSLPQELGEQGRRHLRKDSKR